MYRYMWGKKAMFLEMFHWSGKHLEKVFFLKSEFNTWSGSCKLFKMLEFFYLRMLHVLN